MKPLVSIPNIFHFVFGLKEQIEPFHLMYYICLASCFEVNKPEEVYFHYYHEPYGEWWERIRPKLRLRRIDQEQFVSDYCHEDPWVAKYRYAHHADFSRLRILLEEGGIYADIDTLFLRPIPSSWLSKQFILGQEEPPAGAPQGGSLCNAWIASAPGAEFCQIWLEKMTDAYDGSWSNHSTLLPYSLSRKFPHLLDIEPINSFYSLSHTPRDIDGLFLRSVALPNHAYSLHLWSHLWFEKNRLDFSHFHEGLLTIDYLLFANTTYALHARRFVPKDVVGSSTKYWWQTTSSLLRHPVRSVLSRLDDR